MSDSRTDTKLVVAHLAGDPTALAGIYDRYANPLYDTAAAMLGDRHEAGDVMHDVFLVAAERLGQLREPERLKAWLFAVLRNEVYRRTKRRGRSRPTDFSAPGGVEVVAALDTAAEGEQVVYEELAAMVRGAASGLDERDQLVLELSVRQGLSGTDLADALGVTTDQSYVLVHRMRDRVERSLGAFAVARAGRRSCAELATVLAAWDGTFNVLVRKRVARHIDACEECERTKRKYAVLPLLGAAPALAAPIELRGSVLQLAPRAVAAGLAYEFDADGGFPSPIRHRRGLKLLLACVAATAVLLIGGGVGLVAMREDNSSIAVGPTTTNTEPATSAPADSSLTTVGATPGDAPVATNPPDTVGGQTHSVDTVAAPPTTVNTIPLDTVTAASTTLAPITTLRPTTPPTTPPTTAPATTLATTPPTIDATPGTVVPVTTNPPVTAPPVTAPPVTSPPATTPPATTPPATTGPSPGMVSLSTTSINLGSAIGSGIVTLTNTGGSLAAWGVNDGGTAAPFARSGASAGTLQPGQAAQITFSIDRTGQKEGDYAHSFLITSDAQGGGTVSLTARVERAPTVAPLRPPAGLSCSPTGGQTSTPINAVVTDESTIGGVSLTWTGPRGTQPGSATMSATGSPGTYQGTLLVDPVPGRSTWNWTVTATDVRGNSGVASGSIDIVC